MQKNAKSSLKDVIVVGFAMFAIFFGAGNLIFPPYLGMVSGQEWFKGFLCFMIADAGLAVMTVLAMIRYDGTVWSMLRRLSKCFYQKLKFIARKSGDSVKPGL